MSTLTKSSKPHTDFEDMEPDYCEKLDLFDPRVNSNKFWHIWTYGEYVVRWRGKHGSKGQWYVHTAYSSWNAQQEADKLYWKKKDKGYVKDTTTVLDLIVRKID